MKALDSDADAIIFDLEDSVAPGTKPVARELLKNLPKRSGGPQWWVRINPLGSEFHKDDLDVLGIADIHGIVLPKAESGARRRPSSRIAPATSRSTRSSPKPRRACSACCPIANPARPLAAMSWGAEDLSAALGASSKYDDNGELSLHLQARALAVPGRRGRRRRSAGRRRVRRLQGRRRASRAKPKPRAARASPASSRFTRRRWR